MTDKFPFLKIIPSFNEARIKCKKIVNERSQIIRELITKQKITYNKNNITGYIDNTFKYVEEEKLTESEQIADVFSFLAAGMDTTERTLQFGLVLAAKHQDIQEKVRNELYKIMDNKIWIEIDKNKKYCLPKGSIINANLEYISRHSLMKIGIIKY